MTALPVPGRDVYRPRRLLLSTWQSKRLAGVPQSEEKLLRGGVVSFARKIDSYLVVAWTGIGVSFPVGLDWTNAERKGTPLEIFLGMKTTTMPTRLPTHAGSKCRSPSTVRTKVGLSGSKAIVLVPPRLPKSRRVLGRDETALLDLALPLLTPVPHRKPFNLCGHWKADG